MNRFVSIMLIIVGGLLSACGAHTTPNRPVFGSSDQAVYANAPQVLTNKNISCSLNTCTNLSSVMFADPAAECQAQASPGGLVGFTGGWKFVVTGGNVIVKGVKVYFPSASNQSVKVKIYDVAGPTLLASQTNPSTPHDVVTEIDFASPPTLTGGNFYTVSAYETTGAAVGFHCTAISLGTGGNFILENTSWTFGVAIITSVFGSGDVAPTSNDASQGMSVTPVFQ